MAVTGVLRRLGHVLRAVLILGDIALCFVWLAPLYLIGGERLASRPTGRQMISAYVGRASINGMRWARVPEAVIDWIFERLGDRPDHCIRMATKYAGFAD